MEAREVIVIGAGAAGLTAARQLARGGRQVIILEARRRTGGRIHTFTDKKFRMPAEAGAEFIHGSLETTLGMLREYMLPYRPAEGQVWQVRNGEPEKDADFVPDHHKLLQQKLESLNKDMPVKEFIDRYFKGREYFSLRQAVTGFVEGYESAEVERFSTMAFRDDWLEAEEWEQYRIEEGYGALADALAQDCMQLGCRIRFGMEVKKIAWKKGLVEVRCANGSSFSAKQVVITVPLGIMQREKIRFTPALPAKTKVFKTLGYGNVIKILLLFKSRFWQEKEVQERTGKNLGRLFFLLSQAPVPTWWTQYPSDSALLSGWLSGSKARRSASKTDRQIMEDALSSLSLIFKTDKKTLRSELHAWKVFNWITDEFSRGSYAYATVNGKRNREMARRAMKDTLFFAGEHFEEPAGTVEAALKSGLRTAGEMLDMK